jgi:hypothetical protein
VPKTKKVALLIGNANYEDEDYFGHLPHPEKDVHDMANRLRELGFDVTEEVNQTSKEMADLVHVFARLSANATVALFYFSGHGVQVRGENCLLGINADRHLFTDPDYSPRNYSINLDDPVAELRASQIPIKLFVFDACRELVITKGGPQGLSSTSSGARGSLIAYAAAPGQSALDSQRGDHSIFTDHLLAHLKDEADIITIFARAQSEVATSTNFAQMPWLSFSPGLLGVSLTEIPAAPRSATTTLAEAKAKGAEPLPLSEDDSPLLKEFSIKEFLKRHWKALKSQNVDAYIADFNDPVDWYQQGPTSTEYIRRGIRATFKHWDTIERSISGSLTIIPLSNRAGVAVTYPMSFDLSTKSGTHLKGNGTDILEIRAVDGRLKIFAQDQQIKSGK